MSDPNSPTPDPNEAVPGYTPPTTPEPAAPSAEPPAYAPPAAPGGYEPPPVTPPAYEPPPVTPPAYEPPPVTPPAYEPPAATPPAYEPPAATPPAYEPPPVTPPAYEPPPVTPPAYTPPSSGGYEPPPAGSFPPPSDFGPAGGYPPPPSGGYPPPPGGGYQPPPPPGGGYPPQPPYGAYGATNGPVPFNVGAAFTYAWAKFVANIGPILIVVVVAAAATFVVQLIGNLLTAGMSTVTIDPNTGGIRMVGGIGAAIVSGIFGLISYVVAAVVSMGLIRAALDVTYGRPITVASVFKFEDLVPFLIAQILVGLMLVVGLVLCVIPGLVVAFFAQFTAYFVLDKKLGAVDAIKASFALVRANVGTLLGLFLASVLAIIVGGLLCGVGLLVAYPVVGIASAFAYRKLQGEEVAA